MKEPFAVVVSLLLPLLGKRLGTPEEIREETKEITERLGGLDLSLSEDLPLQAMAVTISTDVSSGKTTEMLVVLTYATAELEVRVR